MRCQPFALYLCFCLLSPQLVSAGKPSKAEGPWAILAIIGERRADEVLVLAEEIQKKLVASGRVDVLPAERALSRLGGPGFIGPLTEELSVTRGTYQQAYLQNYSFDYDAAIANFQKTLTELEKVPDSRARWDLYVKAYVNMGRAHVEKNNNTTAAKRAFAMVLRTRPTMKLTLREHPPNILRLWSKARKELAKQPRGTLRVESDPAGSVVFVDGVEMGRTPFERDLVHGRYQLKLKQLGFGEVFRWVTVGKEPTRVRSKMEFEATVAVEHAFPSLRMPDEGEGVFADHWPWLAAQLKVGRLATVRKMRVKKNDRWVASLVDLRVGRIIREGWLEREGRSTEHLLRDAADLASFLITGRVSARLVQQVPPTKRSKTEADKKKPGSGQPKPTGAEPTAAGKKPVVVSKAPPIRKDSAVGTTAPPLERPSWRTWWPYGIAGGALLGVGVGAHLYSNSQEDKGGGSTELEDSSSLWLGVAIGGYVLAGASILTGAILHWTYDSPPDATQHALVPTIGPDGVAVQWVMRF